MNPIPSDPLDGVVHQILLRYPNVDVTVRQSHQGDDIVVAELQRPGSPDIQLLGAERSEVATAIVGRYTFDNLRVDSLVEFLSTLYESDFAIKVRKFPWHTVTLTVPYRGSGYPVTARWYPGDLERWEIDGLRRAGQSRG